MHSWSRFIELYNYNDSIGYWLRNTQVSITSYLQVISKAHCFFCSFAAAIYFIKNEPIQVSRHVDNLQHNYSCSYMYSSCEPIATESPAQSSTHSLFQTYMYFGSQRIMCITVSYIHVHVHTVCAYTHLNCQSALLILHVHAHLLQYITSCLSEDSTDAH